MNTISVNHEPNSMKEIRMLSHVTWKELIAILVRTDESFLNDSLGFYEPARQNHAVRMTITMKDDRYLVTLEFVWRDGEKYYRSQNTQEFFSLEHLPKFVWDGINGPKEAYSVMLHASEISEYKTKILNYKDNKSQIFDGDDGLLELVSKQLRKSHADSGSYTVEIIPQKLLTKVVVYYDSINRYECLCFYTVSANDLTYEQKTDLADGKTVSVNVVFNR